MCGYVTSSQVRESVRFVERVRTYIVDRSVDRERMERMDGYILRCMFRGSRSLQRPFYYNSWGHASNLVTVFQTDYSRRGFYSSFPCIISDC